MNYNVRSLCGSTCCVRLIVALLCLLASAGTGALAENIDYSDSKYDYTWTDASGVSHTAKITDAATDPRQILALFKKVYLDPRVPGIQYGDQYYGPPETKIDYDKHSWQSANYYVTHQPAGTGALKTPTRIAWLDLTDDDHVEQPDEGMAVLYIEVKPSWNCKKDRTNILAAPGTYETDLDYVSKCYQMVKFVPSYLHVTEDENPGYLFTINDAVASNRFFYASKGRWREDYGTAPLWGSFEEISPNNATGTAPTVNLADSLETGNIYDAIHSCGSVPSITQTTGDTKYGHEFVLDRSTGQLNVFTGLSIFIPERRQNYKAEGRTQYGWSDYNPAYAPSTFLYKAYLTAKAVPSTQQGYYTVTLDWETSLTRYKQAQKLSATIPERFYVYIVDEDGNYTLLDKVTNGKGDPSYPSPRTEERTHSYDVAMLPHKQNITFIISANPLDKDYNPSTITIYSNLASVVIPGTETAFFLRAGEYRSRFDVPEERNYYRNTVSISPQDWAKMKDVASSYVLKRVSTAGGDETVLATVTFHDVDADAKTAGYNVTYNAAAQSAQGEETFDYEVPCTASSGTITADADEIVIIDRFYVSTEKNDQPDGYTYSFLSSVNGTEAAAADPLAIPVFTTDITGGIEAFTKTEVDADIDHSLTGDTRVCIGLQVKADYDGEISTYESINVNDSERVTGKAKRNSRCSHDYSLVSVKGNAEYSEGAVTGTVAVAAASLYDTFGADNEPYCVRISTNPSFDGGVTTVDNSYGTNRVSTAGPKLAFTATATGHTSSWWADEGVTHAAFSADLTLTPTLPADAHILYLYRVWRQMPDGTETLLNDEPDVAAEKWATTYAHLFTDLDADATTTVCDAYIADEPATTRTVTYVARQYSKRGTAATDAPSKAQAASDLIYYITEQTATVKYDHNVITGVEQVEVLGQPVSTTYYSITGQPSATPWQGVSVRVTRYASGATIATKVISK